jgi:hypothetical protein
MMKGKVRQGGRLLGASIVLLALGSLGWAADPVRIEQVGLVAPNVIGLTIIAGQVEYGRQVPYVKQPGDVVLDPEMHRFVRRGDKIIGTLVGRKADLLCTMDAMLGERFDSQWADRQTSYSVLPGSSGASPHRPAALLGAPTQRRPWWMNPVGDAPAEPQSEPVVAAAREDDPPVWQPETTVWQFLEIHQSQNGLALRA